MFFFLFFFYGYGDHRDLHVLSHSFPTRRSSDLLGQRGFTLGYSLLSLAVLAWLIAAAGRAPFVMLWAWKPWHNHLVLAVMAVVCLILALAIGRAIGRLQVHHHQEVGRGLARDDAAQIGRAHV